MSSLSLRTAVQLRSCTPADEQSWLRCRALSFLDSQYHDDVRTAHPVTAPEAGETISWVAVAPTSRPGAAAHGPASDVVGILEVEVGRQGDSDAHLATIDTLAVHPDWRGQRIGAALLEQVVPLLPARVTELDAWTREDAPARAWYRSQGFELVQEYLHVYQSWDESTPGLTPPDGLSSPVTAFFHADLEDEDRWRAAFRRVHRCGRFLGRIR